MTKLIDPLKLLKKRAVEKPEVAVVTAPELPFELPLVPQPGSQVMRMTVGSTYRSPIAVLFDPQSRTTFPVSKD